MQLFSFFVVPCVAYVANDDLCSLTNHRLQYKRGARNDPEGGSSRALGGSQLFWDWLLFDPVSKIRYRNKHNRHKNRSPRGKSI